MNQELKISVVTVVFNAIKGNRETRLRQCLSSVAMQDYPHVEHIVIDGASTDGTLDVLREHERAGRIKLISEPDTGIFNAMNKGLAASSGDYVAYLNSDDFYCENHALSTVADALRKTGADFTVAPCFILRENGEETLSPLYLGNVFNFAPCYHLCVFARKDLLKRLGGFDERYRLAADSDLIARMLVSNARVAIISKPFAKFRAGGASGDAEACRRECVDYFKNVFCGYCGISEDQAERMVWSDYLPWRLLLKYSLKGDRRVVVRLMIHQVLTFCVVRPFKALRLLWRGLKGLIRGCLIRLLRMCYSFATSADRGIVAQPQFSTRPCQPHTTIGASTFLMSTATFRNPFDNPLSIGEECILANHFIFESDQGEIQIGNRVFINAQTQLISRSRITIEDNVTIAWGCTIYDHNSHSLDPTIRRQDMEQELNDLKARVDMIAHKDWSVVKSKPIRICRDVWLGFNVTVLAGVTIGEGAVIGAQSVVRTDIPPYAIAYGNPAKVVGYVRR